MKRLKAFKTTLLGLLFIGTGLYLLIQSITTDYYIIGGLLIGGTLLLFTGDRFINKLEKYVFGKILFDDKKREKENEL